jgi:hypothetical protein
MTIMIWDQLFLSRCRSIFEAIVPSVCTHGIFASFSLTFHAEDCFFPLNFFPFYLDRVLLLKSAYVGGCRREHMRLYGA